MKEEHLRDQINDLIRDEIQEVINDYVDTRDSTKSSGLGFVEEKDELKVSISNQEINKIIKEYKKIKKKEKSNISQIKRMGLVDKDGRPL